MVLVVLQYLSKNVELKVLYVVTLMVIISNNVVTNMLVGYLEDRKYK